MSRWGIVGAFALAFFASPLAIQAQPPEKVFRIGLLGTVPLTNSGAARIWDGFFDGLRQLGYVEGRNVVIEGRYSEGRAVAAGSWGGQRLSLADYVTGTGVTSWVRPPKEGVDVAYPLK